MLSTVSVAASSLRMTTSLIAVPLVADFDGDRPVVPEAVAFSPDDAGV